MAGELNSPYMNLPVPGVSVTLGPTWATDLNNCFTIIDQHDHSSGSGVPINPSGLDINSDLSFEDNNLVEARSLRLYSQDTPIAESDDLSCLYDVEGDLYYNDGSGNQIQITDNGGVAGTPGSIANLTSPASASYVALDSTFVWQSDANTAANMDAASLILRNATANSFGLTLAPPAAMGADFSLTLPPLPASQKIMTLDAAGAMAAPYTVDSSTIVITTNVIQIPSNVNLPGSGVQVNSKRVITSNTNAAANLAIIRLYIDIAIGGASILSGEGASVLKIGAGEVTITYSSAFADIPVVVATPVSNAVRLYSTVISVSSSVATVIVYQEGIGNVNQPVMVMIIGQRA